MLESAVSPPDPPSPPSVQETRTARLLRHAASPVARCLGLAVLATALLTGLGLYVSQDFHARAHYHYDSAAYRYSGLEYDRTVSQHGRLATAGFLLKQKDSLDCVVRVLVFPQSLTYFHGHLFVQVPFMCLFFFLALWYVHRVSGSFLYGVAALATVYLFGTVYHPVQALMDYWKDNLAIWLLGGALLSWFLSEGASRRGWACLSGVLWSLLAMQRVVIVVYGIALFLPFLAGAVYHRVRAGAWGNLLRDGAAFGAVPLVVAALLGVFQGRAVYEYYTVTAYDYTSHAKTALYLWEHPFSAGWYFRLGLAAVLLIPAGVIAARLRQRAGDLTAALWVVLAFPALVIATKALFHAYSAVLLVLVVAAVCRLVPRHLPAPRLRGLSLALLLVVVAAGLFQARHHAAEMERYADRSQNYQRLYAEIGEILAANPPSTKSGLFFDECNALVRLQMFYDRKVPLATPESHAFMSVHATYYKATFGEKPAEEIARTIIADLEKTPGSLAFVNASEGDLANRFQGEGPDYLPYQVNSRIIRHVQSSDRWQVARRIESPIYGPLLVCQYAERPLSQAAKWAGAARTRHVPELSLTAAVGPAVRQFTYSAPPACPAEFYDGVSYQWIPAGRQGLRFAVYVERPTAVEFRSIITPGYARQGTQRTVVVRHGEREQRVTVNGQESIRVPLELREGLNAVEILSGDEANVPPAPGDNRPLLFRLDSPYLAPAAEAPKSAAPTAEEADTGEDD